MKKVLLVVIDAFATRVLLPALDAGELPGMAHWIERGVLRKQCTSIFPSITPAATASIATGVYPTNHHVAGSFWYDRQEDNVAYYGDDFWVMLREGVNKFLNDFLIRLNHDRLHAETLYQRVERHGLTAACLNYMWFRGETQYEVNAPLMLKLFPRMTFKPHVLGPKVLGLADFAASMIPGREERLRATGGLTRRYGFHDATTTEYLLHLATADPFPDFTLAYFPNNDYVSHQDSPHDALCTLRDVDRSLSQFIDAMGGPDRFFEQFVLLITGDHSQSDVIRDKGGRRIEMEQVLRGYRVAPAGEPWGDKDELIACPNMRACHVYVKDRHSSYRDRLIAQLLDDPRVDQVFWRESVWDGGDPTAQVDPRSDTFSVATRDRGTLTYRYAGDDPPLGRDIYGNAWVWKGDLGSVGGTLDGDRLEFREYPNALERIATGFCQLAGDLWVTAKNGCEFATEATSVHDGGSHGALNEQDSTAPLIVAGLPGHLSVPNFPRTIDVAPLCLQILDLAGEAEALIRNRVAGQPV